MSALTSPPPFLLIVFLMEKLKKTIHEIKNGMLSNSRVLLERRLSPLQCWATAVATVYHW